MEKILIRKEAESSPKYGCSPSSRKTEDLIKLGIINIDKPAGPTSHQVSAYLRDILHIKKCGHSGTLDPNVTGVLPIALEKGTKVVQAILTAGKEYVCVMHIHNPVKEYDLFKSIENFIGKINQMPPVKSSVKRQWRKRSVYYIEVLEIQGQDVLFKVGCQAGTYIRKLVHDIGQDLKTGAHMSELRRTKAGPFDESTLFTLQDVADAYHYASKGNDKMLRKIVQPIEAAVAHLKKVWVMDTSVDSLCHGASLGIPGISKLEAGIVAGDSVAVLTLKGELVCYGEAVVSSKEMMGKKGIGVKTSKVIMEIGTYPRMNLSIPG